MPRRKDGIFAQVSCRILHGQRFNALSLADQGTYLKLWILAVRERRACLPGAIYGATYASFELHMERRACIRALTRIASQKLIEFLPDETIIVEGIKECHKKLDWE